MRRGQFHAAPFVFAIGICRSIAGYPGLFKKLLKSF